MEDRINTSKKIKPECVNLQHKHVWKNRKKCIRKRFGMLKYFLIKFSLNFSPPPPMSKIKFNCSVYKICIYNKKLMNLETNNN